jgi:hypothetical protein
VLAGYTDKATHSWFIERPAFALASHVVGPQGGRIELPAPNVHHDATGNSGRKTMLHWKRNSSCENSIIIIFLCTAEKRLDLEVFISKAPEQMSLDSCVYAFIATLVWPSGC